MQTTNKPVVRITGQNGNTLNLASICAIALKRNGMRKEADELSSRVFDCKSQDEAIKMFAEYCILQ